MNRPVLLVILFCFGLLTALRGQDLSLFSTSGGLASSNGLFLSYSLGELCIAYTQSGSTWVTEGFQQPGHIDIEVNTADIVPTTRLLIYPNPFSSSLTIKSDDLQSCQEIQLSNVLGQQVYFKRISAASEELLDVPYVLPGLYVLTIRCMPGITFTQTIIKL